MLLDSRRTYGEILCLRCDQPQLPKCRDLDGDRCYGSHKGFRNVSLFSGDKQLTEVL